MTSDQKSTLLDLVKQHFQNDAPDHNWYKNEKSKWDLIATTLNNMGDCKKNSRQWFEVRI